MTWVASLIASLIGATAGALAANKFALQREIRQDVMRLFVKLHNDLYDLFKAWNKIVYSDDKARGKHLQSAIDITLALNNHCFSLELVFGNKAKNLIKQIKTALAYGQTPDESVLMDKLEKQLDIVEGEIRSLWKGFDNSREWATD